MFGKKKMLTVLAVTAALLTLTLWRSFAPEEEGEAAPAAVPTAVPEDSAYVLRAYEGCVAIFHSADSSAPASVTDIEVRLLPACDREQLLAGGIGVKGRAELSMLLEDLGS